MQIESRSIVSVFQKVLGVEYDTQQCKDLFNYVVEHFCMQTNIADFHKKISSVVNFNDTELSASQFRLLLSETGYVVLNLRYYATFLSGYRGLNSMVAEENYARFDLCRCDAVRVFHAVKIHRTAINKFLVKRKQTSKLFCPSEFEQVRNGFAQYAEPIQRFIRYKTKSKLKFVYQSNNIDKKDFHSELTIAALRAYYKRQPCNLSYDHMLNYLRASVRNTTCNLIDKYTTEKRQTLIGDGEGADRRYRLNVEAMSQITPRYNGDGEEISIEDRFDESAHTKSGSDFDFSVDRMLDRLRNTKKGFILAVYVGREVAKFTQWLREKRYIRTEDKSCQDFLAERGFDETASVVAKFMGSDVDYVHKKLREVALELGVMN
jgi:hypothetical protein